MKNQKWFKAIALVGMLSISASMLAGCQAGRNYSGELAGNSAQIPTTSKQQSLDIPYTGGKPIEIVYTDDPVEAGLCDSDGNLADGSGKVDLSALGQGGSSNNGGSTVDKDDADTEDENDTTEQPDTGDTDAEDSDDPYAAMKADESGTKIRFMCQNIRYDATADQSTDNAASIRRYRFKALVEKYDPDVICTQEACSFWTTAFAEDLGDKYDMYYHFREPVSGSDEACPVLWKKDKYEKLATGNFWLSDTPDKSSASFVEGYYPRVANWVKLKDKTTGSIFTVHSTHFGFDYTMEHINKIRQLFVNNFNKNGSDAYNFMMGDWNIYYDSEQYYGIANINDMIDLRLVCQDMQENGHAEIGDFRTGTSNGFKDEERDGGNIIDFIVAKPAKNMAVDYYTSCYEWMAVPEKGINEGWVSDHFAQVCDVRIDTDISYAEYYPDTAK